jgi:hypothetical protein
MIKIFRTIRKKLFSDIQGSTSPFTRYMIYAIGEIILVVIGILIALQINNWNEKQKLKSQEIETLQNFSKIIRIDLERLDHAMAVNYRVKKSMNFLINYLSKDLPYSDSLKYHFGNTNIQWLMEINSSVFETLKSKDLNLISNDSLRQDIINLYSWAEGSFISDQNRYRILLEDGAKEVYKTRFNEFWYDNYEAWKLENTFDDDVTPGELIAEMKPLNFDELNNDQEYIYFLKSLRNRFNWYVENNGENMITLLSSILNDIDNELTILNE